MSGLLEVIALDATDAEQAEVGGADRVAVYGELADGGLSPTPKLVAEVRRATSIQLRVMVRLRDGFSTDGGEAVRLRGLMASYAEAGADGMILGFLNGLGEVDVPLIEELISEGTWPWTFHRALDATLDPDRAWLALRRLSRLDQVVTAGSARDVENGLGELLARAKSDPWAASLIMAGGGLRAEHVPWLTRAGVTAFQVGSAARPGGSYRQGVDAELVRSWRSLISQEARHRSFG